MTNYWNRLPVEEKYRLMKKQNDVERLYSIRGLPSKEKEETDFIGMLGEHFSDPKIVEMLKKPGNDETEEELLSEFRKFCQPYSERLRNSLIEAWNLSEKDSDDKNNQNLDWNQVRHWDGIHQVKIENCECFVDVFPSNSSLNNRSFWFETRDLLKQFVNNLSEDVEKLDVSKVIKPNKDFKKRCIYFQNLREWVTNNYGISMDLNDSKIFSQKELHALVEISPQLAEVAYRLNHCEKETMQYICDACNQHLWTLDPEKHESVEYFHDIANVSIQTILAEFIGNSEVRAPKTMKIRNGNGDLINARAGYTVDAKSNRTKRNKNAIREAFFAALKIKENFEITANDNETFYAIADDLQSEINYECIETEITKSLAKELMHLKPVCFFANDEYPEVKQLDWANKLAANIMRLILDRGILFTSRKVREDSINTRDEYDKHILSLTKEVMKDLNVKLGNFMNKSVLISGDTIDHELTNPQGTLTKKKYGGMKSILHQYFSKNGLKPMRCPPKERNVNDYYEGGYLNKKTQHQNPMITNNFTEQAFRIHRFTPSLEAVTALNHLQNTEWMINLYEQIWTIADILIDTIETELIENFKVRKEIKDNKEVYYIDFHSSFPSISLHEVISWKSTLQLMAEFGRNKTVFWHPWSFDWRGRMVTCSTLLSPQNNDLSRSILKFSSPKKLSEQGWIWMQRIVAKYYVGRSQLPQFLDERENEIDELDIKNWGEIQKNLGSKTWEAFETCAKDKTFQKVLRLIAREPYKYFDIWGKDDVFRPKAEGFQRLAFTIAYVNALDSGGIGAEVDIPIVLDASSNVYQHAAAMMREIDMAKSVNVLPTDDGLPSDIYLKIQDKVKDKIKGLMDNNDPFFSNFDQKILDQLIQRNVMKKPVMTIGYGAKDNTIWRNLISHNGEDDGLFGETICVNPQGIEIKKEDYIELKKSAGYKMENGTYYHNNKKISKSKYDRELKKEIGEWRLTAHESSVLGKIMQRVPQTLHQKFAQRFVKIIVEATHDVLPGFSILMDSLIKVQFELSQSGEPVSWVLSDGSSLKNIKLNKSEQRRTHFWKGTVTSGNDNNRTVTIFVPKKERNESKEKTGLPPNFVHSHDACHMRYVINNMCTSHSIPFWSVHDAFGCHPNDISQLIDVVKKGFIEIHTSMEFNQGTMQKLYKEVIGEELEEIGQLDLTLSSLSDYLIS